MGHDDDTQRERNRTAPCDVLEVLHHSLRCIETECTELRTAGSQDLEGVRIAAEDAVSSWLGARVAAQRLVVIAALHQAPEPQQVEGCLATPEPLRGYQ